MATKNMMGVLAGMAIAPLCGAIVATLSCAPAEGNGTSDRGDTLCPNKADCPEITDGGVHDGGGVDGGCVDSPMWNKPAPCNLDVARLKRLVEGRYVFLDYGNPKTTNLEVRVCEHNLYPPSVVCLFASRFEENTVSMDWSLMYCEHPLNSEGKCPDSGWWRGQIWRCNCQAIGQRSPEDEANCRERNDPQNDCEDWGGGNNWGVVVQTEGCGADSCRTNSMNPDNTRTFRRYF